LQHGIEESPKLKRKLLLSILAVVPAALMPLAAMSQIAPDRVPTVSTEPSYKYEVFAGWGYTSLNQVNQSRNGLQGVSLSITRDWGKYFGLSAEGGHYAWGITAANPGNPTVDLYMAGPVVHTKVIGPVDAFVHGLVGGAHTGNISISPDVSLAGGLGMGLDYAVSPHFAVRAYGDDIASSFTLTPYQSGDSPHMRWNAHASVGLVYKF
jgi:hypothetical protein